MKGRNSLAVFIFLGALLTVCFGLGLSWSQHPGALLRNYGYYNVSLEQFLTFCAWWYLPFGIIGIPMLVISLTVSLIRESKEAKKDRE